MAKQVFSHGTYQVYGEGNHGYCARHDKVLKDGESCPGCEFEQVAEAVAAEMNGQPTAEDLDKAAQQAEAKTEG